MSIALKVVITLLLVQLGPIGWIIIYLLYKKEQDGRRTVS
jgi:hypothetical protein